MTKKLLLFLLDKGSKHEKAGFCTLVVRKPYQNAQVMGPCSRIAFAIQVKNLSGAMKTSVAGSSAHIPHPLASCVIYSALESCSPFFDLLSLGILQSSFPGGCFSRGHRCWQPAFCHPQGVQMPEAGGPALRTLYGEQQATAWADKRLTCSALP